MKLTAETAIKKAKSQLTGSGREIDMGQAIYESGITGYQARQMQGVHIPASIEAGATIDDAQSKINKIYSRFYKKNQKKGVEFIKNSPEKAEYMEAIDLLTEFYAENLEGKG